MASQLYSIGAILLSTAFLLLGYGLTNTLVPLRAHLEGFSDLTIGALFWQTWGVWLIGVLHVPLSEVEMLRSKYGAHAYLMVVQVLTPVPFTLVSVSAGLARVPLAAFVLYATILRSLRFIAMEAVLVHLFGDRARLILERYMEVVIVGFLVLLVVGFVTLRYL